MDSVLDFSAHSPFASWQEAALPAVIFLGSLGTGAIFRFVRRRLSVIGVVASARAAQSTNAALFFLAVSVWLLSDLPFNLVASLVALLLGNWCAGSIVRYEKYEVPYYHRF